MIAAAFRSVMLEKMPGGHAELADQLRRATISIPLNIAESAGKPAERTVRATMPSPEAPRWNAVAIVDLMRMQALVEPPTPTRLRHYSSGS